MLITLPSVGHSTSEHARQISPTCVRGEWSTSTSTWEYCTFHLGNVSRRHSSQRTSAKVNSHQLEDWWLDSRVPISTGCGSAWYAQCNWRIWWTHLRAKWQEVNKALLHLKHKFRLPPNKSQLSTFYVINLISWNGYFDVAGCLQLTPLNPHLEWGKIKETWLDCFVFSFLRLKI